LNFVGEISKILLGTLTQADAKNYNKHIVGLEKEQKEYLHLCKEQMTIIKTTITSVNSTLQRVSQNEKILKDGLNTLLNYSSQRLNELKVEAENVNLLNEQFRFIQRGIDESQHSFEILVDAFIHAEQGVIQPQLITIEKIKNLLRTQRLPNGLDYPNLPFSDLQKIITPHTYAHKQFLLYVIEIPLFSPVEYHLYKVFPFPSIVKQEESTYSYMNFNKEFMFSDSLRRHYGKMSTNELTACYQPNEFTYACSEEIPMYTYVPDLDCEAMLLHSSTVNVPDSCEYRFFKLSKTFWIPLEMSNQWLFVAPQNGDVHNLVSTRNDDFKITAKR
jgi:hypothetical protein